MACATIRANAELLRCRFGADPSDATEACTEIAIQQGLPSVDADRLACEAVTLATRDAALSCASARRSCSSDADCGGDEGHGTEERGSADRGTQGGDDGCAEGEHINLLADSWQLITHATNGLEKVSTHGKHRKL